MAYLAQLGALTDELVTAVARFPEAHREKRDACREFVLRSLRHHNFARTNQFEVQERLDGLEERFCVAGRDALAEALRTRLDALAPHRNQCTPEVLHFLLELADQPVQKANLGNLDALVEPEQEPPPTLTWRDIAREDGWKQERDIWRFVDYSPGSSDEDEVDARSDASLESLTTATSAEDKYQRTAQELTTKPQGGELLNQVGDAQAWRHASAVDSEGRPKKIPISTSQLLRETLFMLGGLETTLFDSACTPVTTYQLSGVSWDSHKALVTSVAECGRRLEPLRAFVKRTETSPLLQVFQDCLQKALRCFDVDLSSIEARLVAPKGDVIVSVVGLLEELAPKLAPLYALADIVRRLQEERNPHAFRYLELLYDAVGLSQLQGNRPTYRLLGTIFFDCFRVYLKPIRLWMEEGKLLPADRTFFVSESPTKLPLHQIWKSQFNLRRSPEGNLHAPRFLRPAIHRIFTAGKSIVVLRRMKQHQSTKAHHAGAEPSMDFATICPESLEPAPFSELFSAAFDAWIQSKHHTAAATLRELLLRSYGLSESLDALERIYLMSDGARSDAFAASVFRHLDSLSGSWKDRFTLTEMAQEAFSACVDGYRLSAEIDTRGLAHSALVSRSSVRLGLPAIRLRYRLDWPVQMVVPDEGIQGYQALFTFQLQARRALSVLHHRHHRHHHPATHDDSRAAAGRPAYYLLRARLLWFCTTVTSYLTMLVLAPQTARLRADLRAADDVDGMAAAHTAFVARALAESCLGPKLRPIRDGILDVFDLALRLEDARRAEARRREAEDAETSRLEAAASPYRSSGSTKKPAARWRRSVPKEDEHKDEDEEEDGGGLTEGLMYNGGGPGSAGKPYVVVLRELQADFERHLRFVAGGLRGVARASKEEAASKWDLLAEMLEVGIKE